MGASTSCLNSATLTKKSKDWVAHRERIYFKKGVDYYCIRVVNVETL